jgi:hypothetical protein
MTRHLQRAEELNAEVDAMEAKALRDLGAPVDAGVKNDRQAYQMKKFFEHSELYRQRGNARDLHLRLATAYALAALTEANS